MHYYSTFDSPVGPLLLLSDGAALVGLWIGGEPDAAWQRADEVPPLAEARQQLRDYFAGARRTFALPLAAAGTPFQQKVWAALQQIPYGETISYGELARRLGQAGAARAVGLANGRNPLAIVVPCHRVVGSNGKLVGFRGGLPRKQALLALEQGHAQPTQLALQVEV